MLQILSGYKSEVIISNLFDPVSDNPSGTVGPFYEIELAFVVLVDWEIEFCFVSVYNVETVFFRQWSNFVEYIHIAKIIKMILFLQSRRKSCMCT